MLNRLSKKKPGWTEKMTMDGMPYYYNTDSEEVTWEKPFELLSKSEQEDGKSSWVWVPHPTNIWQPAKVLKTNADGSVECKLQTGSKVTIPTSRVVSDGLSGGRQQKVPLWDLSLSSLRMPEEDLVMLPEHNEALLIHNIRARYEKDELYTWVGASRSVLISVNPFKKLNLYGEDQISLHLNRPPNKTLKAHVYDIANDCYKALLFENKNQSVLISGESGAGKTVCTKQCLDFLAKVAGSSTGVEKKILVANPLLEAFGNAQTIRNNNSSRFGKWIEVHFDPMERKITSAEIINYLLERSRVVHQQKNERNYHIFYQLTSDARYKSKLGLLDAKSYNYLNQSGCYKAKDIDDLEEHKSVLSAMDLLQFTDEEKDWVMQITSGVLTLGNVEFKSKQEKGSVSGSAIKEKKIVQHIADFLEVKVDDLERVLCYRSISVRGKVSSIPLDPAKARSACDSLAMGIYGRLFDFLVRRVNDSLTGKKGKYVGILDIFGFEIFDQNSFEQLCINFANEKLQQQFNRTTFKEEEALYQAQGITYQKIDFIDNQVVLDLIEKRPHGILMMLDDECKVPEGADEKFMNKIETNYKRSDKFQTNKHRRLENSLNFEIVHYAGIVKYNADGFMVKNTDSLFQDMITMCAGSGSPHMQSLFPASSDRTPMKSLSKQFTKQLSVLMDSLYATESRYIRCVKPNSEQVASKFNAQMCLDQLRYSGVFEAVEIRRQGFPFRLEYKKFVCRYSCINRGHRYSSKNGEKRCGEILSTNKNTFADMQFGKTMLLYRSKEYKLLELLRNLALETLIPKKQGVVRGHLAREMKRRLLTAERTLNKALKVGNDIDMMDDAINKVEPTVGTFRKLFSYQPRNLQQAISHRADLKKWKDLEVRLVKLVDSDPNKVYYKLAEAVEDGKKLMHIPRTSYQEELIAQAIELRENCELGKIDIEAKEVLDILFQPGMEDVLSRSKRLDHTTADLKEIERLLDLDEMEFVQMELDKAIEMKDEKRRIHREIRLKDLFLDKNGHQYKDLHKFPNIKDGKQYAAGKLFGGAKTADQMLVWTKAASRSSLTVLEAGKPAEKGAVNAAKFIRGYMGEKKTESPTEQAASLLSFSYAADMPMIDEVYLQVLKQLVENPSEDSAAKGWELLGLMMSTVSPSLEAERFVIMFVRQHCPEDVGHQQYTSALHEVQYGNSSKPPSSSNVSRIVDDFKSSQGSRYSVKRAAAPVAA